jgi:RNA polymerase sigma-70 factor (ECF subfamily)
MMSNERVKQAVGKYLGQVWRVLCRSGLRPADADDAAQDVFFVLSQRIDDVHPAAERSFVLSTALRIASQYRRTAWNRKVTEVLDPEFRDDYQNSPEFVSEQKELLGILDSALESLDNDERAVFILMELEQLTRDKTAEVLGIPTGTVASRLRRAKENFTLVAQRLQIRKRRSL